MLYFGVILINLFQKKLKLYFIEYLKKGVEIQKLNSIEIRVESFFIINVWQQIEGIKDNVFSLDIGRVFWVNLFSLFFTYIRLVYLLVDF